MTVPDYSDLWRRYWADLYDGSRRPQIEHAARSPLGRWLVADAATLVEGGNGLVLLPGASVVENPRVSVRTAVVTYRCLRGHETSVRQPLFRHLELETCGESDCGLPVVPDDTRTRARRVTRFTVEAGGTRLSCVATGRYAAPTGAFDGLAGTRTLELTAVLRPVARDEGAVEPTLEVLHADPD